MGTKTKSIFAKSFLAEPLATFTKCSEESLVLFKDLANFMKKRVQIEEEYAKKLQSLKQSVPTAQYIKSPSCTVSRGFVSIVEELSRSADAHLQFASNVTSFIVQQLDTNANEYRGKKREIQTSIQTLLKDLQDSYNFVNKTQVAYHDANFELEAAITAHDRTLSRADPNEIAKAFSKKQQAQTKVEKTDTEYQTAIEMANQRRDLHYGQLMPDLLLEFQTLEEKRADGLKFVMANYSYYTSSVPAAEAVSSEMIHRFIESMDTEAEINYIAETNKSAKTVPAHLAYEAYSKDKVKARSSFDFLKTKITQTIAKSLDWEAPSGAQTAHEEDSADRTSVFKKSLDELMAAQEAKEPGLKVPIVLIKLVEDIRTKGGYQTEGLFRIPPASEDIRKMRTQIDAGNYNFDNFSVHVSASVLKLWLRELKEPLIPQTLYEECLKNSPNRNECLRIKSQLSSRPREVLEYLLSFLRELQQPENVMKTKMGAENLSMIFAPCVLRCKAEDMHTIIFNSKLEAQFMLQLISSSDSPSSSHFVASQPNTSVASISFSPEDTAARRSGFALGGPLMRSSSSNSGETAGVIIIGSGSGISGRDSFRGESKEGGNLLHSSGTNSGGGGASGTF